MNYSFENVEKNIDSFIKRYYLNKLIRGFLLSLLGLLITYLTVVGLEYFFEFKSSFRKILFFSYFILNSILLIINILIPWFYFSKLVKGLDRQSAAVIIGKHFNQINDQLLNTIQLNTLYEKNKSDLVHASIEQKVQKVNQNNYADAVPLKENFKLFPYLGFAIVLFLVLYFLAPDFILKPTSRLINYHIEFQPFYFEDVSKPNFIEEGQDAIVLVKLSGEKLPKEVYIESSLGKFLTKRVNKNTFTYTFKKIKKDLNFKFTSQDYYSQEYGIQVFGKSMITQFDVDVEYPKYLNIKNQKIRNFNHLQIPEGSVIQLFVSTKNIKENKLEVGKQTYSFKDKWSLKKAIKEKTKIKLIHKNVYSNKLDSITGNIDIIKDLYPIIAIEEEIDSLNNSIRSFEGIIEDDYGLSGLFFSYKINNNKTDRIKVQSVKGLKSKFDFAVDFSNLSLNPTDSVKYWFTVIDNDGVNGPKSTNSKIKEFILPSLSELNLNRDKEQENTKENLSTIKDKFLELNNKIKNLDKDLFQKENQWNNKEKLKKITEEYNKLSNDIKKSKDKLSESLKNKNKFSEIDKELLEKQELLEDLLEELMDDDTKKLLEEIEELLNKNKQDLLKDKLEELNISNEQINKKLDRSIELLKRNRVNEKIDDLEKQLKALSDKQEELLNKDNLSQNQKIEEQKEINKEYEQIKEDFNKLDELNDDLERPLDLGDLKDKKEEVQNELNNSKENLEKGKNKQAKKNQKSSSEKMKDLAQQLNEMQNKSNSDQQQEDMDAIRRLLQNLISLSLNQEEVLFSINNSKADNSSMVINGRRQKKIKDESKMIIDSLYQLAKRQPSIASFIDKETEIIQRSLPLAIKAIAQRNKRETNRAQQKTMTSFNNLALILDESLQSLQQQMQSMMEGSGQCNNPGGGRPKPNPGGMGDIKEMLQKQLEQLKKGSKSGGNKEGSEPGETPGMGNKEIAKMAAEQAAIRKKLEEINSKLKNDKGLGNTLNELIKNIEQQEKDLVNKRFNNLFKRQKEILTRLLESEKAMNERGMEEKRESKTAKNNNIGNNFRLNEYKQKKQNLIEDIRTIDPRLNKYYKEKANEYLNY